MPAQNLPGLMLDPAHPLARGLVGWWPMNEGGGERVNDVSIYRNAGVLTGVASSTTSGWRGSPQGLEIALDASNDIILVPHTSSLSLGGDVSLTWWAYIASLGNYQTFFDKQNGAGVPNPFQIGVEITSGRFFGDFGTGSSDTSVFTADTLAAGRRYFLGVVRIGQTLNFYINGRLSLSGSLGAQAVTDAGNGLHIGGRSPGTLYGVNGAMSQTRIYNRALDAREVAQLYADPLAGALAPSKAARYYTAPTADPPAVPTRPLSADRLNNRTYARIFRRGETG